MSQDIHKDQSEDREASDHDKASLCAAVAMRRPSGRPDTTFSRFVHWRLNQPTVAKRVVRAEWIHQNRTCHLG
jgi:hypothetical protein